MTKKIISAIILITVLCLITIGFIRLKKKNIGNTDIYRAIPADATILFECNDVSRLYAKWEDYPFLNELSSISSLKNLYSTLLFLDSLNNNNSIFKELFSDNTFYLSMHTIGKEDCGVVIYMALNKKGQDKEIVKQLNNLAQPKGSITERKYDNSKIYDYKSKGEKYPKDFSYSIKEDIVIFSFSSLLLENALRQLSTDENIANQKGFSEVKTTAGRYVDGNIYINYKNLPKFATIFLNSQKTPTLLGRPLFANWTELDIKIKEHTLQLNGFTYTDDSSNNYLNLFTQQEPQQVTLDKIAPSNTEAFVYLGLENNQLFRKEYIKYLTKSGNIGKYNTEVDKINQYIEGNIEETINALLHNEIAMIVSGKDTDDTGDNAFIVMKTNSKSYSKKLLLEILNRIATKENKPNSHYKHVYKLDSEVSFDIYEFPIHNLIELLFGRIFSEGENKYFAFIDNYLVFGPTVKSLSDFIYMNVLHKTLEHDANYNQFTEFLSDKSNLFFYCNADKGINYISKFLNEKHKIGYKDNFDVFKKYQAIACQFNSNSDLIFSNLAIEYFPEYHEEPHTLWESLLDTITEFKPKLVVNHNTNEKEIFLQDINNTIYLINKSGRILWKVPLPEKIMSDVYQIDYYKNNKLQYLFNTKNNIYLIDRNGNNVERYPVQLRYPASNGLALFDYENNKNYRIFIADEDRNVYLYSKEGNIIPGWEFEGTEYVVHGKIQHFRVEDKDYIVMADKNRIYILDRKGNIRVSLQNQFSKSKNNQFTIEHIGINKKARLATTDTLGKINYIYFDGKTEKINLGNYSSNHFFDYQDVDADGTKDFIILDKNKLLVMNQNQKIIFDYQFNNDITFPPVYYHFSATDRKIGVVSEKSNKLYLIDRYGKNYKGFPLKGHTLFSIGMFQGNANNFNLIVGSSDGFLYNYIVQ